MEEIVASTSKNAGVVHRERVRRCALPRACDRWYERHMCLALPGRIEERTEGPSGLPFARVRFGAVTQDVCLTFVPDAQVGEYVIVHVGFAIQKLDAAEAQRTLALVGEAP